MFNIKKVISDIEKSGFSSPKWWPNYIYHFSGLESIVSILSNEIMYSRSHEKNNRTTTNASEEVISHTKDKYFEYVRFYFRPKTPTQFRNEGYKPEGVRDPRFKNADIPVPIFLLFDIEKMFGVKDALISERSLASSNGKLVSVDNFDKFDHEIIYSSGYMPKDRKSDYREMRHAEFVIKNEFKLEHLKHIWCRTVAESETLIYFLKKHNVYDKYKDLIILKDSSALFYNSSLRIQHVSMMEEYIDVFFKSLDCIGKEEVEFKVCIESNSKKRTIKYRLLSTVSNYLRIPVNSDEKEYTLTLFFDDKLVYKNEKTEVDEIPY